jgi:hypothetical protein
MCMNLRRFCSCGRNSAYLSCRDNLLSAEILVNLFCPECRPGSIIEATMLADCGWVLEYDVDRARPILLSGVSGARPPRPLSSMPGT